MKSNFSKIPIFLSVIFFSIFLAAFLFFYKTITANDQESRMKEEEWQNEAERREEIKSLDRSVKIIEGERTELETHFARSTDAVPFLDTMEGLAVAAGTKAEVTSVDISKDQTALVVGMKASGSFSSLYKFLKLLENSPYVLEFAAVDIEKGESGWQAEFHINLLSFVP